MEPSVASHFILGACFMFYGLTAWLFLRKGGRLAILVALLMITICVQCIKDAWWLYTPTLAEAERWHMATAFDMIAVPMYAFILMELVRPGSLNLRVMLIHEIPFVILPLLLVFTGDLVYYYILLGIGAVYGTTMLIWTAINIPRYHRILKERYSYTDNINLNWLRLILITFYFILALWIADCVVIHIGMENLYMVISLVMWMVIDLYIYKHESVIGELAELDAEAPHTAPDQCQPESSQLSQAVRALFIRDHMHLNPTLKLSDIAAAVGTNRTYVSNYFNREEGATFYDYVNRLRIDHACTLLTTTDDSIKMIASESGFNSPQSFIRVFTKFKGISPAKYRCTNC